MKKIINGKLYNTDTAQLIAEWSSGFYGNDFRSCEETLYRTKKGVYFLHGEGGPMTKWAVHHGNSSSGGEDLIVLSEAEAKEWLEETENVEAYEQFFAVEEA